MSIHASAVTEVLQQLGRHDPTLKRLPVFTQGLTDAKVAELADCLLAHPNVVEDVFLGGNRLTDETGVKLARYVAASSTIRNLSLNNNQLGPAPCLALATALRVNTSLRYLHLYGDQPEDKSRIDAAFVSALRLNPSRPADSYWRLYAIPICDFKRLKKAADALGPLSMLEHLAIADE